MPLDGCNDHFYFISILLVWGVSLPFTLAFFRQLLWSFLRKNCFKKGRWEQWEHLRSEIWKLSLHGISAPLGSSEQYTS